MSKTVLSLRNSIQSAIANKIIFGNEDLIDFLFIAWLSRGHVLIEGPSGTGKTTAVRVLARLLSKSFARIQVTSDLTPSGLLSSGPEGLLSSDFLLASEINDASPRLHSVLLDAMDERKVTVDGKTYQASPELFVVATQTSLETESAAKLTTAQADHYMLKLVLDHLEPEANAELIKASITDELTPLISDLKAFAIDRLQLDEEIKKIRVGDSIIDQISALIAKINENELVASGISARGGIALGKSIRVLAALTGREFVLPDDVKVLAVPVFRHRVRLTEEAITSGQSEVDVIEEALTHLSSQ